MEEQDTLVAGVERQNHFVRRTTWAILVCILYLGIFGFCALQYYYTHKAVWMVFALWLPTALCFMGAVFKTSSLPEKISIDGDTLKYWTSDKATEFKISQIKTDSWHYFKPNSLAPVLRPMVVYPADHVRLQGLSLSLRDDRGEEQLIPLIGFPVFAVMDALKERGAVIPCMVFTRYVGLGARECELVFEPTGTIGQDPSCTILVKDAQNDPAVPLTFQLVDSARDFDPKVMLKSAAYSQPKTLHLGSKFKVGKHHYFFEPIKGNYLFSAM